MEKYKMASAAEVVNFLARKENLRRKAEEGAAPITSRSFRKFKNVAEFKQHVVDTSKLIGLRFNLSLREDVGSHFIVAGNFTVEDDCGKHVTFTFKKNDMHAIDERTVSLDLRYLDPEAFSGSEKLTHKFLEGLENGSLHFADCNFFNEMLDDVAFNEISDMLVFFSGCSAMQLNGTIYDAKERTVNAV